jgi:hypothetical protein
MSFWGEPVLLDRVGLKRSGFERKFDHKLVQKPNVQETY